MKIPSRIKIGAIYWRVLEVEPSEIDCDSQASGDSDNKTCTIRINKHLPTAQKELTLLHEVLHSINEQLDHVEVEFLALCLQQIFSENEVF